RAAAGRALADRGKAYGIPGMQVDGMDVLAVRAAAAEAIAHCRAGKGPYILEM
ncbi:MAG TPA: pyruvate dehydrogenase (acetyl-transferring) E1 component subunit alpha, partial [Alphaproteobacteria bacterium]|nr:pyruvate dehydrogenase (acetyl-transferring) E1 component subunit alpha [Alphaproteobacteria bacterium]